MPDRWAQRKSHDRREAYIEKLRDPRWQKKRLEIFERDGWACKECKDTEKTLHVHHCYYMRETEPWDYPQDALMTLCEDCHAYETDNRPRDEERLLQVLRKHVPWTDALRMLSGAFGSLSAEKYRAFTAIALTWLLEDESRFEECVEQYLTWYEEQTHLGLYEAYHERMAERHEFVYSTLKLRESDKGITQAKL